MMENGRKRVAKLGLWVSVFTTLVAPTIAAAQTPAADQASMETLKRIRLCGVVDVGPYYNGLEAYFRFGDQVVNVSRGGGAPFELKLIQDRTLSEEDSKSLPPRFPPPTLKLLDGDKVQFFDKEGRDCKAAIAVENGKNGLRIEAGPKPGTPSGKVPEPTTKEFIELWVPPKSSSEELQYPPPRVAAKPHLCSIAGVGAHKDGLEVFFVSSRTVNASRGGGAPTQVTVDSRDVILDKELFENVPREKSESPFFVMRKGDVIQYADKDGRNCKGSIAVGNGVNGLLIEANPKVGEKPGSTKAVSEREFIAPQNVPSAADASEAEYKAMLGEFLQETAKDEGHVSYDRNDLSESLFYMPPPVVADPVILLQVNRINAEVRDAVYLKAKSEKAKASFKPRAVFFTWGLAGMNGQLASLTASGFFADSTGVKNLSSMALVVDRKTGRFVTDASDLFIDQLASAKPMYCVMLDIDRVAKMLDDDPKAGSKGHEIFDASGLYLGKWVCPAFGETAISFHGKPGAQFDRMKIVAAPGVAGPVHQGALEVELNITEEMFAQIKPEYREAFQAKKE